MYEPKCYTGIIFITLSSSCSGRTPRAWPLQPSRKATLITPVQQDRTFSSRQTRNIEIVRSPLRRATTIPNTRQQYRPFLLDKKPTITDWIGNLELGTVTKLAAEDLERTGQRLKVLVLFGSLRWRLVDRVTITRLLSHTRCICENSF